MLCCRAALPAPPCAACGPEKPPHFSLFKSYNAVDFFPILCFWGTLPKSTIFARARPPPLIFPFSFFEFSRSACAPLKGTPRTHFAKIQKRKRKRFGATKLWPCLLSLFVAVLLLPPRRRPVPLLLCCALVCRDYCCCAAVAVLVCCCCAGIPAPPCAARGLEKPPHFSLLKSYNSVDFFPILCFWGTLPKSTIFCLLHSAHCNDMKTHVSIVFSSTDYHVQESKTA